MKRAPIVALALSVAGCGLAGSAPFSGTLAGTFTSSAGSGSNAFAASTSGARFDIGAGASDYFSSSGTQITTPANFRAEELITGDGIVEVSSDATAVGIRGRGTDTDNNPGFKIANVTTVAALQDRILGSIMRGNFVSEVARISATGAWVPTVSAVTTADNGGGTAAATSLNPASPWILGTCNDTDGCDVTAVETDALDGFCFKFVNMSANVFNFPDTSGVSESAGAFAAGQYDSIEYCYATDRYIEMGRSNN